MSISIKNVTKIYGEQTAVNDISFEIQSGEIVGFLGPNGAGKSTTMKMITTYIPQNSGTISICGIDTIKKPLEVKEKVGYLPEHNPLYTDMYVKEYLLFLARLHRIDTPKERVKEMIHAVGLDKEQNKKIGTLSKGYRQRVGLAQAMLHNPEVLILDEPTSGLDPNQLVEIRALIKSFAKDKTVLLSTHIMQEVEAICDRIIIINDGNIVANDQINSIKSKESNKQLIKVTFDSKITPKDFTDKKTSAKHFKDNTWFFETSNKEDLRKHIAKVAQEKGLLILEMQQEKEDLESIFKKLTK
ncbi:MAG: gliding motility-associated ABC transporter ATP-binding subunit GldA [Flavobacteriales bacterium]|jgi:ABC-2 type transport system ATP-binding protein|nr:gliding motility-associated ABC transporter ATP-binding subunit GldA [Flavobacteriales bacterium]